MQRYNLNRAKYGTHQLIAEEIGTNKTVLDIGCNKGYLKELAKNNIFYGIDYNKEDLELAKKRRYKEVFELDLNNYELFKIDLKFDVIIFAGILEHLMFSEKVLNFFITNHLKSNGKVIISLPNVANFTIRVGLLFGNFNYTESGILDKTHLHLYTLKSAKEFINRNNLEIIKEKFSSNRFGRIIEILPFLGTLLGYELIFVCQKEY